MCSRSRCLLLCVGLSLAGVATAAATLISIVTNYCATDNACEHRTETLSYMSRDQPARRTLAAGMTCALLLLLPGDLALCDVLAERITDACIACVNYAAAGLAIVAAIVGIVSVTADPDSTTHLHAGIAWLSMRVTYLVTAALLAFPESHRANVAPTIETLGAWCRLLLVLLVVILGVVVGVQVREAARAPSVQDDTGSNSAEGDPQHATVAAPMLGRLTTGPTRVRRRRAELLTGGRRSPPLSPPPCS